MKLETRTEGGVAVALVAGDLDGATAPRLEETLLGLLAGHRDLVIGMKGVPYVSSAGLRALLAAYKRASAGKGRVVLAGLGAKPREIMSMTGLLGYFLVADTPEDGVAELAR